MDWTPYFTAVAIVVIVGVGLFVINKRKDARTTYYTGLVFITIGLVFPFIVTRENSILQITSESLSLVRDTFIIIASVGANLVAASVLLKPASSHDKLVQQLTQLINQPHQKKRTEAQSN